MPYGVEYWYSKFNAWTDTWESNSVFWRNIALAFVTVAAIVVGANFLPFSDAVQSYFVVPGSLILFLAVLAVMRRLLPEDRLTLRDRFSPRQRRQGGLPIIILVLALFVLANSYLPYLVGGLVFLSLLFAVYNTLRRTPTEIKMELAGVLDPRDFPEEYEEYINDELYEQLEEELSTEEPLENEQSSTYVDEEELPTQDVTKE